MGGRGQAASSNASGRGRYIRSIGPNAPAGAGSQLDSASGPGDSCCR